MLINIVIPDDINLSSVRIHTNGCHPNNVVSKLRRAISAIEAEILDYEKCPIHQKVIKDA